MLKSLNARLMCALALTSISSIEAAEFNWDHTKLIIPAVATITAIGICSIFYSNKNKPIQTNQKKISKFDLQVAQVWQRLGEHPDLLDSLSSHNRNILHQALLQHNLPYIFVLLRHQNASRLLAERDKFNKSPKAYISTQRNNVSVLEAAFNANEKELCQMLINLGAGDHRISKVLMEKKHANDQLLAQQKVHLHELRIRQNLACGCIICFDQIPTENTALLDCCFLCLHHSCAQETRKHNNSCPQCRKPFGTITEESLSEQANFNQGLQAFFTD